MSEREKMKQNKKKEISARIFRNFLCDEKPRKTEEEWGKLYFLRASFLFCPALLFLIYYVSMAIYGGAHVSILYIWLIAALIFVALGTYILFVGRFPYRSKVFFTVAVILAVVFLSFAVFEGFVISHMGSAAPDGVECIIVLGARVRGDEPSLALSHRIDAAYQYLTRNPDSVAVLSGGRGSGEDISEAECMRRELTARGIDDARLVIEDRSTDTSENIRYSFEIIGDRYSSVAVVTNNFHVFRALCLARAKYDGELYGISASFNSPLVLHFAVREYIGFIFDVLHGNM